MLMTNLGVYITKSEVSSLFNTMDIDKNGKIDIDEFLFFLANNQGESNAELSKTLLNVIKIKINSVYLIYTTS
jgi:Ca2+-binding EF-hand superfamily protein